jgi:hypothetical protein
VIFTSQHAYAAAAVQLQSMQQQPQFQSSPTQLPQQQTVSIAGSSSLPTRLRLVDRQSTHQQQQQPRSKNLSANMQTATSQSNNKIICNSNSIQCKIVLNSAAAKPNAVVASPSQQYDARHANEPGGTETDAAQVRTGMFEH